MMRSVLIAVVLTMGALGCGEPDPVDVGAVQAEFDAQMDTRDDDLGVFVTGMEAGGGSRVTVATQLDEDGTAEAEAICNSVTSAAASSGVDVAGVDVAAAGGRYIAACAPLD